MKRNKKRIVLAAAGLAGAYAGLNALAKKRTEEFHIDEGNPYIQYRSGSDQADTKTGAEDGDSDRGNEVYLTSVKPIFDKALSFAGLVILCPVLTVIAAAVWIDDPGPIFFKQKRVGKDKQFFWLHKFRTMKMSTPHDVPTHQLKNPEQYITRVGAFLRKTSLDELPQIWDIFCGKMSIIGPRPALWNQEDLIAERDKYGANDVLPGLTGWAQINGRDELEIPVKAKLDGEYIKHLRQGGIRALFFDCRCFAGTILSVLKHDGVVEGGTGEIGRRINRAAGKEKTEDIEAYELRAGVPKEDPQTVLGCDPKYHIDRKRKVRVLITGTGSYIGENFEAYAKEKYPDNFEIDTLDMIGDGWKDHDFSGYECVFHVAGIAHADVGKVDEATKEKYYRVNTDLAIETAKKAKAAGVRQFVFMSSMIIYGESAPYGQKKVIDEYTVPAPANFYGDSKWQADKGVRALANDNFHTAVLRPPMIYGKGSKGNYPQLSLFAQKLPIFPDIQNERSMLYIENLCEFLAQVMIRSKGGIFWPQNASYSNTSELVRYIGYLHNHKVVLSKVLGLGVRVGSLIPGKIGNLCNKAFGNLTYDKSMSRYDFKYQKYSLKESLIITETDDNDYHRGNAKRSEGKHILLISQYFHPETFRVNDMACEWVKRGYKVTVLTGIPNYPMGKYFDGYDRKHRTREQWNGVDIIRIPLVARGNSSNKLLNAGGMAVNYLSFVNSGRRWVKSKEAGDLHADFVFTVEVSPMTQALIGIWYSKRYNVPSYLYVQDLWPENVEAVTGIQSKLALAPIDRMVDKIYQNTGMIFTTSPSFVEAIVNRRIPVDKEKVHYWPQYAEEFYRPMEPQPVDGIEDDGSFRIAFTGNIGTAQGLDVLPKAAALLKNENIKFIIVGDGRYQETFEQQIDELSVRDKFIMVPRVPAEKIPKILSNVDAGFISFTNTPLWTRTIPAKLQSYMACGKAIIASASGETKRVITEAGCGVCTAIGDADALADGIRKLMTMNSTDLGHKAREYFEAHFDKKKLMDEMDGFIKAGGK